jgi:hypothetical protein
MVVEEIVAFIVEDTLGKGVLLHQGGKIWRLIPQGSTIMACVPGPEKIFLGLSGSVPWWVTSFDCRKSRQWNEYLRIFDECWPGEYQGPREAD